MTKGKTDKSKRDIYRDPKLYEEEERLNVHLWDAEANDPLTRERGKCLLNDKHSKDLEAVLKECQIRVRGKEYTLETCHQEMKDLFMAVDHCVGKKAFLLLK